MNNATVLRDDSVDFETVYTPEDRALALQFTVRDPNGDTALCRFELDPSDAFRIAEELHACAVHASASTGRFFVADSDGVTYSFVARDLDHCREILVRHGVVFYAADGSETNDVERAAIEWTELTPDQASLRMTSDDGQAIASLRRLPLSQRALGDWFCSEY